MPIVAFAPNANLIANQELSNDRASTDGLAPYAKESISTFGRYSPTFGVYTLNFDPMGSLWFSFYVTVNNSDASTGTMVSLQSETGQELFRIRCTADSGDPFEFRVWDNTTSHIVASIPNFDSDVGLQRVDIKWSKDEGVCRCYRNKGLIGEYTGELMNLDASKLILGGVTYASNGRTIFSSVFVADEETRGINMVQHSITGQGSINEMTGDFASLQQHGVTIKQGMYPDENLDTCSQSFTLDAVPAELRDRYVVGVGVAAMTNTSARSRFQRAKLFVEDDTGQAETDSDELNVFRNTHSHIFNTAPDGSGWTTDKLDSCEFGLRFEEQSVLI